MGGEVSEDGRYLVISLSRGADRRNRLYYAVLGDPLKPDPYAPVKALVEEDDAEQTFLGNMGTTFYVSTDFNAPKRRIASFDIRHPGRSGWKTVVPEAADVIETPLLAGQHVVLHYLVDVQSHIRTFTLAGKPEGEIPLPGRSPSRTNPPGVARDGPQHRERTNGMEEGMSPLKRVVPTRN